jgi:hypothetical protein
MRRRLATHLVAVLIALVSPGGAAQPRARTPLAPASASERLLIAELYPTGSDDRFERLARTTEAGLAAACGARRPAGDGCFARHLPPTRERLAVLYSGPSESSPPRVELRLEVTSDMPCGDVEPPGILPPVVTVSPSQLFDPNGRPRFRTKYAKGC